MPRRTSYRRRKGRGLHLAGGNRGRKILGFLKKANTFLRKHRVLSRAGAMYGRTALPYSQIASKAGSVAGRLGYGRGRKCRKHCRRRVKR